MSKLKIGDKVEIVGDVTTKGVISTIKDIENCRDSVFSYVWSTFYLLDNIKGKYLESELRKVREGEVMRKTFKEVIADIKEGEVWKTIYNNWDIKSVELKNGFLIIKRGNDGSLYIHERCEFTLQRKKVSFTEAFKAYEEGKVIESCVNNYKIKIGSFSYDGEWLNLRNSERIFTVDMVKGEWYIND